MRLFFPCVAKKGLQLVGVRGLGVLLLDGLDPVGVGRGAGEDGGEGHGAAVFETPGDDADYLRVAVSVLLDQRAAAVALENTKCDRK